MGFLLIVLGRRCRSIVAFAAAIVFSGVAWGGADSQSAEEIFPWNFGYAYPMWQEADDYRRISEYFTGKENQGGDMVLRTDGGVRQGLYFRVGLPVGQRIPKHARVRVEYLRSDIPQVLSEEFVLPLAKRGGLFSEVRFGLTGRAWPSQSLRLVAWKITLRDEAGRPLAQMQSYLWGLPKLDAQEPEEK